MKPRQTVMIALFVGPLAACADQSASYAFLNRGALILHLSTVVAAVLTAGAVALSYRVLVRKTETFAVDRFLAWLGLVLNAFFLLVVLAGYGLPKLLLNPTD